MTSEKGRTLIEIADLIALYRAPVSGPADDRTSFVHTVEEWRQMVRDGVSDGDEDTWLDTKQRALGWVWTHGMRCLPAAQRESLEHHARSLHNQLLDLLTTRLSADHRTVFEDIASDAVACWLAAQLPPGPHQTFFELVWSAHSSGSVPGSWRMNAGAPQLVAYKIPDQFYRGWGVEDPN
jgi:hypothetical protein